MTRDAHRLFLAVTTAVLWLAIVPDVPAHAWLVDGHRAATLAAIDLLSDSVPQFFVAAGATVAEWSAEPDLLRSPLQPLSASLAPDHYVHLELLDDADLVPSRYAFLEAQVAAGRTASQVGLLPYAVLEGTQRLTVAFAHQRAAPADRHVRSRCLLWAGILAHYAQDLAMPLHTTVHHDGRLRPDGTSPGSGLHRRVDSLFERLQLARAELVSDVRPDPHDDLVGAVRRHLRASHRLVEKVYELQPLLMDRDDDQPAPAVVEFGRERFREAVRLTAELILTAWVDSERLELPEWQLHDLQRSAQVEATKPDE